MGSEMCIRDSGGGGDVPGNILLAQDPECGESGRTGCRVPGIGEACLLYTSDAAAERSSVDLGGRRIIKKKTK